MFNRAEYIKNYRARLRSERRAFVLQYLGGKCSKCGTDKKLHADHVDPSTKLFNISQNLTANIEKLKLELDKCQLLCGPCHGAKTALDNGRAAPKHGTISMYVNHKCRCNACRSANSAYARQYKAIM